MKLKAAVIKAAVANGIHTLPEIKLKWREFEEGGDTKRPKTLEEAIDISRKTKYTPEIDDLEGPGYREYMRKLAKEKAKVWGAPEDEVYDGLINPREYNYRRWYNLSPNSELEATLHSGDAHWMDVFGKSVDADTFSNESPYSGYSNPYNPKGIEGGTWTDQHGIDEYTPSESQIANNWPLNRAYFAIERGNNYYKLKIANGELTNEVPSIMTYKGAPMLPEVTVTPKGNYIDDGYGNPIISTITKKYAEGGDTENNFDYNATYYAGMLPEVEVTAQRASATNTLRSLWVKENRNNPEVLFDQRLNLNTSQIGTMAYGGNLHSTGGVMYPFSFTKGILPDVRY